MRTGSWTLGRKGQAFGQGEGAFTIDYSDSQVPFSAPSFYPEPD